MVDEKVAVAGGGCVGLTALRLQAEPMILAGKVCKGPGVDGAFEACRSCNIGRAARLSKAALCTVTMLDSTVVAVAVTVLVMVEEISLVNVGLDRG